MCYTSYCNGPGLCKSEIRFSLHCSRTICLHWDRLLADSCDCSLPPCQDFEDFYATDTEDSNFEMSSISSSPECEEKGETEVTRKRCKGDPDTYGVVPYVIHPHGTIKWSYGRRQIGCHCKYHDNCKFDKVLSKQPLGLCGAWLKAGARAKSKAAHKRIKEKLMTKRYRKRRRKGRKYLKSEFVMDDVFVAERHEAKDASSSEPEEV